LSNYDVAEALHNLGHSSKWNIKRVIYRSITLFVSALGRLHKIENSSCFQIIDELLARNLIEKEDAIEMSFAVAIACQTRLKVYMSKQNQDDHIGDRRFNTHDNKIIHQLRALIGEQSLGDFFLTARKLHLILKKTTMGKSMHLKIPLLEKFVILFLLDLHNFIQIEWERYNEKIFIQKHSAIGFYVAYSFVKNNDFGKALEIYNKLEECFDAIPFDSWIEIMRRKAHCLCEFGRYAEGLEYIQKCMSQMDSNFNEELNFHAIGYMKALQGDCERHLGNIRDAARLYSFALITICYSDSVYRKNLQAKCWYFMGKCLLNLGELEKILESAKMALDICERSNIELSLECKCNRLLGECYMLLCQPQVALKYFEKELNLNSRFVTYKQEACDSDIMELLARIQHATNLLKQ